MRRLSKDEYFLALSNVAASRATCDRLWAGCVLTIDGEIVSTGYNGAPSDMQECDAVGHLLVLGDDGRDHCVRTIHAEQNALYQAKKKKYRNLQGATAYINATPCEICLSELLKWGVKRIVCGSVYQNSERIEMTQRLVTAWSAVIEYQPMPDITLTFGTEVEDVKRIEIKRLSGV
jgi:dCMP deaminase